MRYLIYTRVSTEKQEVEWQDQKCKDYVSSVGGKFLLFSDPYKTGKEKKNRPNLELMLQSLRKGDIVVVYKLDRFSRDIIDMVTTYRRIIASGATIKALEDPYSDEFSVSILGAFAQREREDTAKKTKDKLRFKAERKLRYGSILPYGFYLDTENLVPIKRDGKIVFLPGHLLPHPKEQEALQLMYKLYDEGYKYSAIIERLTEQGFMNRKGKPFQKMTIYRILLKSGRRREPDLSHEELELQRLQLLI